MMSLNQFSNCIMKMPPAGVFKQAWGGTPKGILKELKAQLAWSRSSAHVWHTGMTTNDGACRLFDQSQE